LIIDRLEEKMAYGFGDKNLIRMALTHSSAINEKKAASNQRLEFLGDAVLQLVISTHLYLRMKDENEGVLSKLRSLIVCADSLFAASESIQLGDYVILGKGEELSGGREKKNIIADAFESVIGAVYLDGGYAAAETFILDKLGPIIENSVKGLLTYDFKTMLQEYVQSKSMGELSYQLIKVTGPEHDQTFYSRVVINDTGYAAAEGHNRKQSEQNAAELVLKELEIID